MPTMPPGDVGPWVDKAEQDLRTAETMASKDVGAAPDTICFLSQQAVEKYLKAFLVHHRVAFPKTHALDALLDLAVGVEPSLDTLRPSLITMNPYAVEYRYPGESANVDEAMAAVTQARQARSAIRLRIGLPG